jgi:hypothetical protein
MKWYTQYNFTHYYKSSHYEFYLCEYEKDKILHYINIELQKIKNGFYRKVDRTYIPLKQL